MTHFISRDDVAWMLQRIGFTILENVPLREGLITVLRNLLLSITT